MNREEIINRIRQHNEADIPTLQKEFNASYKEIKQIIEELVGSGKLVFAAGIKYVYADDDKPPVGTPRRKPEPRKLGEQTVMDVFEITDKRQKDFISDVIESGKKEKRNSVFVSMRRNPLAEIDKDEKKEDEKEDKKVVNKEEKEKQSNKSIINSLLEDDAPFGDNKPKYSMNEFFDRYVRRQNTPITADVMPKHPAWIDEKKFEYEVKEHLEKLIKSDKKMKLSGAVERAQMLLDAVRETNDNKIKQVYERMVYELLTADSKLYGRLKNRYFAE